MTIAIDLPKALQLLDEAVEERGADYIDPGADSTTGCSYVAGDKPGCILGVIFHKAGVSIDVLTEMDSRGSLAGLSDTTLTGWDIELTGEARQILVEAQRLQDEGSTWGAARERALRVAGLVAE